MDGMTELEASPSLPTAPFPSSPVWTTSSSPKLFFGSEMLSRSFHHQHPCERTCVTTGGEYRKVPWRGRQTTATVRDSDLRPQARYMYGTGKIRGHDVVYGLKTSVARAGMRTQWSHSTVRW